MLIIIIIRPAAEVDLWQQLSQTNNDIKKNAKAFGKLKKKTNNILPWQEFYGVLSGGYIYFYRNANDDEFIGYYYIKDAEISLQNLAGEEDVMKLKSKFGIIYLKFPTDSKKDSWIKSLKDRVNEMKSSFDVKSQEIDKDKTAAIAGVDPLKKIFGLEVVIRNIEGNLYDEDNNDKLKKNKL